MFGGPDTSAEVDGLGSDRAYTGRLCVTGDLNGAGDVGDSE